MIEETFAKKFIGKYTLGSVDPSHQTMYATPYDLHGLDVPFPAMSANIVGTNETWLAYDTEKGIILQMGNLLYLSQRDDVGTVTATDDVNLASRFKWSPVNSTLPSENTTLEIWVENQWQPIFYGFQTGIPSYLVYQKSGVEPQVTKSDFTFLRTTVTPSLSIIQATKSAVGADLQNADLSGSDLSGVDFSNAYLNGAILDGAKFPGGKLCGANLVHASMNETDFTNTLLNKAIFDGSDIRGIIWGNGSIAGGASFIGCIANGAKIKSETVTADWSHTNLFGSDFGNADFSNVDLSSANLLGCSLVNAIMESTILISATLGGVKDSTAANLSFAYLSNVNLKRANCFGVTFASATIYGVETNLSETATLEQADFSNCYLEGINFSGTMLRGSRFDGACLIGANFTGADLSPTSEGSTPTSLAGVCLQGAQFTQAKLAAVNFVECTVAFEDGTFNVRYCGTSGLVLPPPDYLPINHHATIGLDETTLQPDTVCPNGITLKANQEIGNNLQTMLTATNPATKWVPLECKNGNA